MLRIVFFFAAFLYSLLFYGQGNNKNSIEELRQLAKNTDLTLSQRLEYSLEAVQLSRNVDSTFLKSNIILSNIYLHLDDYPNYKKVNDQNLEYALKLDDTSSIAYAYHQLGWYYDVEYKYDSAYYCYYNAQKLYRSLGNKNRESEILINMAIIQEDEGDYVGAEKNAVTALQLVQDLPINDNILDTKWSLNNQLGLISNKLKDHKIALDYYNKTLAIAEEHSEPYYYQRLSQNNIGNTYNYLGEHDKALPIFQELVNDKNLIKVGPNLYIITLSNLARTRFLLDDSNHDEIVSTFNRAYKISDSIGSTTGKIGTLIYMSDYYFGQNMLDSSLITAKQTYTLSKEIGANEFVLQSLKRMSDIEKGDTGNEYLNDYIKLSDSLIDNERAIRNKFARIEFETDQIKAEKEKATKERQIFMLSSIALLVTLFLLYIIVTQRTRNRKLAFAQQQQEANEEIYNLMLAQQDKIEEGRTKEKKRISEELHDGVLGRLFGTRLSLDSLNLQNTDDAVKTRGQYIDELKSIEQEIRKISHDLNADFVVGSSFSDIIKTLVENQTQAYQLEYDFHQDEAIDWDELSNKTKIHVYRMLQETMQNTYKHANASTIKISFEQKNSVILLTVIDDGDGFNLNKARKGIGLKNFESRAKEINGKVDITSKPGEGTKVLIEIPLN